MPKAEEKLDVIKAFWSIGLPEWSIGYDTAGDIIRKAREDISALFAHIAQAEKEYRIGVDAGAHTIKHLQADVQTARHNIKHWVDKCFEQDKALKDAIRALDLLQHDIRGSGGYLCAICVNRKAEKRECYKYANGCSQWQWDWIQGEAEAAK